MLNVTFWRTRLISQQQHSGEWVLTPGSTVELALVVGLWVSWPPGNERPDPLTCLLWGGMDTEVMLSLSLLPLSVEESCPEGHELGRADPTPYQLQH